MREYPEITQQEFCEHIEDEDFFLAYGNPVVIQADSGTKVMCMAFPLYERIMREIGRGDEIDKIIRECAEKDEQAMGVIKCIDEMEAP